jgi:hypothetical protein
MNAISYARPSLLKQLLSLRFAFRRQIDLAFFATCINLKEKPVLGSQNE